MEWFKLSWDISKYLLHTQKYTHSPLCSLKRLQYFLNIHKNLKSHVKYMEAGMRNHSYSWAIFLAIVLYWAMTWRFKFDISALNTKTAHCRYRHFLLNSIASYTGVPTSAIFHFFPTAHFAGTFFQRTSDYILFKCKPVNYASV